MLLPGRWYTTIPPAAAAASPPPLVAAYRRAPSRMMSVPMIAATMIPARLAASESYRRLRWARVELVSPDSPITPVPPPVLVLSVPEDEEEEPPPLVVASRSVL